MLSDTPKSWILALAAACSAIALAFAGILLQAFAPGASPTLATALLAGSLGSTVVAFGGLAARVRRLEMENMGLIEEISQEFDRVKDKLEIFSEALAEPRTIQPEVQEENVPMRRVTIK